MYQQEGDYARAESVAAEVLASRRHRSGSQNPNTVSSALDLGLACTSEGKFTESEALAREALEFYQKQEPDDWQRYRAESVLGASLAGEKKYQEAEPFLTEGYRGMLAQKDKIAMPDRYHLDRAREWLIQLYVARGKPEQAAEWRKK